MGVKRVALVCGCVALGKWGALADVAQYAVELSGGAAHLQVESDATFPPSGNASVTVEMWINIAALPSVAQGGSTLSGWGVEGYYGLHYLALTPAGNIEFNHWGAEYTYLVGMATGVWHHVCAVHDGAVNRDFLYIDGTLFGSNATPALAVGKTHVRLGQHPNVANYPFFGRLDEVRIWSVARTAEAIGATWNQSLIGAVAGLAGRWGFDEGAGAVAASSAGDSRPATLPLSVGST